MKNKLRNQKNLNLSSRLASIVWLPPSTAPQPSDAAYSCFTSRESTRCHGRGTARAGLMHVARPRALGFSPSGDHAVKAWRIYNKVGETFIIYTKLVSLWDKISKACSLIEEISSGTFLQIQIKWPLKKKRPICHWWNSLPGALTAGTFSQLAGAAPLLATPTNELQREWNSSVTYYRFIKYLISYSLIPLGFLEISSQAPRFRAGTYKMRRGEGERKDGVLPEPPPFRGPASLCWLPVSAAGGRRARGRTGEGRETNEMNGLCAFMKKTCKDKSRREAST